MSSPDDAALDTWLAASAPDLADDGFSAAVMRRVQAEQAALQSTLDPTAALVRLQQREGAARRRGRWQWLGAGVGAVVAAAVFSGAGKVAEEAIAGPQVLALLIGLAAAAWWLTDAAEA